MEDSPEATLVPEPKTAQKEKGKRSKKRTSQRPLPTPEPKLFEQLGNNMLDKLVCDLQIPLDTPTLLDRLKSLGIIGVQPSINITPSYSDHSSPSKESSFDFLQNTFFDRTSLSQRARVDNTTSTTSRTSKKTKEEGYRNVFTLRDFAAVDAISTLTDGYDRASHMGILDGSYSFFVTRTLDAALCFKVKDHICLVGGDPLCPEALFPKVLEEFAQYRRKHNWGIIFVGASDAFASYARQQNWTTIQFGSECVLNPVTNPVLREETAKRIVSQNRQLLNPAKGGTTLGIYNPFVRKDLELQQKLVAVYEAWRDARNQTQGPQAFITVYDPFAITGLMTYVYTMDRNGTPNGFAALRRLGANNGFHVDPCIAAPSAPRGISDLLIFSSMALLNATGCAYLSFGYEPLTKPGEIFGMPRWLENLTRKAFASVCKGLKVAGKKRYYDKWRPDEEQRTGLHLVFPAGTPGVQDMIAVMHFSNISLKCLVCAKLRKIIQRERKEKGSVSKDNAEQINGEKNSVVAKTTERDLVESTTNGEVKKNNDAGTKVLNKAQEKDERRMVPRTVRLAGSQGELG